MERQQIDKSLHLILEVHNRPVILYREEAVSDYKKGVLTDISIRELGFETDADIPSLANLTVIIPGRKLIIPVNVTSVNPSGETNYVKTEIAEIPNEIEYQIAAFVEQINLSQQGYAPPGSVKDLQEEYKTKAKLPGKLPEKEKVAVKKIGQESEAEEFKEYALRILNETDKSVIVAEELFLGPKNVSSILETIDSTFNILKILVDGFHFSSEIERGKAHKRLYEQWRGERKSYKHVYCLSYDEPQKGLEDHLSLGAKIKEFEFEVSTKFGWVIEEVRDFLKGTVDEERNIEEVFGEALLNAIEHGQKDKPDEMIKPGDKIMISCGYDSEKIALSVIDFYGGLKEETIEHYKGLSEEDFGIETTRGMGIFIMKTVADELQFNIKEGEYTQAILEFRK